MKAKRFTEEQIVKVLQEAENGVELGEVCRRHGMSKATYFRWRAKYSGMLASDLKRLRSLEQENGRLKKLLADAMLDNAALKEIVQKKW